MRNRHTIAGAACGAAAMLMLAAGPAIAATGSLSANLDPIPGNGVDGSGTAMVKVDGTTLTVTMAAMGLLPDQPHAAHIHYGDTARHECPTLGDDDDDNGHLNTSEGVPAYGEIVVSLTKTGDTSADSGLAVDRFDTAKGGKINYERGSIKVSGTVAGDVLSGDSVVVIHGVDYDGDGEYSGDEMSDLDPDLPTEATDPALCGVLAVAPHGGMATGGGGTAGGQKAGLIALGGSALLAAAGTGVLGARRARLQD